MFTPEELLVLKYLVSRYRIRISGRILKRTHRSGGANGESAWLAEQLAIARSLSEKLAPPTP